MRIGINKRSNDHFHQDTNRKHKVSKYFDVLVRACHNTPSNKLNAYQIILERMQHICDFLSIVNKKRTKKNLSALMNGNFSEMITATIEHFKECNLQLACPLLIQNTPTTSLFSIKETEEDGIKAKLTVATSRENANTLSASSDEPYGQHQLTAYQRRPSI